MKQHPTYLVISATQNSIKNQIRKRHKKAALYPDGSFRHCCSDCEDTHFCTSKLLRQHKNEEHIGLRCNDCGSTFSSKGNLNNHTRERKFESCKECGVIVCNSRALNTHMNTHRYSQCDVCLDYYPTDRLKYHILIEHEHKSWILFNKCFLH